MDKIAFPRNLPMFFRGQQQSEEFARGAWAASDAMTKLVGHDVSKWSSEKLTEALADEFIDQATMGGDYSRGFVTAMVQFAAFRHCVGGPNMDVWRPLRMDLRFTSRGSHPTPGSSLYELDGEAVSVAPDMTVYAWNDDEDRPERSAAFLERVQKRGQPISQRKFDALRKKPRQAARRRGANAASQSEMRHA